MINTFFSSGTLDSPAAFLTSLLIGLAFGVALERAGFGSSRRLAGIFYFRDMAVLKVMFTAVIVAMLGVCYAKAFGWVTPDNVYFLHTLYAAQILGGLIFGVGFVMGGWCPGTAAVGVASGKIDALVFLAGAVGGSILYNEVYPAVAPLTANDRGVVFGFESLGVSEAGFAFVFTLIAVGCFWGAEAIEKKRNGVEGYWNSRFLKVFSAVLAIGAFGLFAVQTKPAATANVIAQEQTLLTGMQEGADHIEVQELADRLLGGDASILLVDIRTPEEYAGFHIRSAVNIQVADLPASLAPHKNQGLIVLYSNGMTHPAQARDSLSRLGFGNVYQLTDGLQGFLDACLKPVSLRAESVPPALAVKIRAWRAFFLSAPVAAPAVAATSARASEPLPAEVETEWLAQNLGRVDVKPIDMRPQPEYNGGHIPGALSLNIESLRGCVEGIPSTLLPAGLLAEHFSLMGIRPEDSIVVIWGDKEQDATLVGMACARLGHRRFAVLRGGFAKWQSEKRPLDTLLPVVTATRYPVPAKADAFTVGAKEVLAAVGAQGSVILDVRPADFFTGKKRDEARGGHIPGAINRPFTDDVAKGEAFSTLKPVGELAAAYAKLIPAKDSPLIIHCRTGHQASQTFFVLTRLLGYTNVRWYDAGWTEWAARPELPVVIEAQKPEGRK
jgi:thiosulfate/3-mercaptopyruvate sulfurtransferase